MIARVVLIVFDSDHTLHSSVTDFVLGFRDKVRVRFAVRRYVTIKSCNLRVCRAVCIPVFAVLGQPRRYGLLDCDLGNLTRLFKAVLPLHLFALALLLFALIGVLQADRFGRYATPSVQRCVDNWSQVLLDQHHAGGSIWTLKRVLLCLVLRYTCCSMLDCLLVFGGENRRPVRRDWLCDKLAIYLDLNTFC